MENIKLDKREFLLLAELIVKAKLGELNFKPIEVKLIFNLETPVEEISEFYWNIDAGFIKGKIKNTSIIFPPKLLISDYIDDLKYHPYSIIAATLQYIETSLTSVHLLEKLQLKLNVKFVYLSLGQAKAIIKRKLKISLTSAERNDISRLRRKFKGYQKLITAFENMVDKATDDDLGLISQYAGLATEEYISSIHSKLKFMCWECKIYKEFPLTAEPITPPMHHNKLMTLVWGSRLTTDELSEARLELQNAVEKGVDGLEKIEPIAVTTSEKSEAKKIIGNVLEKLISIEQQPEVEKVVLELILETKNQVKSMDLEVDSYGNAHNKVQNARNFLLQLKRTTIPQKSIFNQVMEVETHLDDIYNIIHYSIASGGPGRLNPRVAKSQLKPIPNQTEEVNENNHVSIMFKCELCGQTESPTWEFVKKQSSKRNDILDIPIHCDEQMKWIIVK